MTSDPVPSQAKTNSAGKLHRPRAFWLRLTEPPPSLPEAYHRQARLLSSLLLLLIVILLLIFPLILMVPAFRASPEVLAFIAIPPMLFLAYGLSRTRHYQTAAMLTISVIAVGAWCFALTEPSQPGSAIQILPFVVVSVVLSSVLLSTMATVWLSAVHLVGILVLPLFYPSQGASPAWETLLIFVGITCALTILVAAILRRDQDELRQRSLALAESEVQLQAILDNSTTFIHLKDADGRFLLVNRQFETALQLSRAEMVGKTEADLFPKQIAEASLAADQKVLQTGRSLEAEETFETDAGPHTYLAVKFPLYNAQGKLYGIGSVSTDITDRKQVEEALLHSEERFRLVSYATNDAVWDWDFASGQIWWSQSFQRLFGYTADQVKPEPEWWEALLQDEDREKVIKSIQSAIDGGEEFWSKEFQLRRADGSYAHVFDRGYIIRNEVGKPVRMLGAIMDITVRKWTEEALARERYLLDVLIDTIPDAIYFKDTKSRFIRSSKALAKAFGLTDPADVIDKTDFDFFTEEHARQAFEDEQRIVQTGQPMVGVVEKETWSDRPDTWVLTTKMPLRDEKGNIIGTFGISRDITERKQNEQALKEANEKQTIYISEMEQYTRETALLNEMGDLLQTCPTVDEAYRVIGELTLRMFPHESGGLYIINASRNLVELVTSWGPPLSDVQIFEPDDCWGLRLGRLHVMNKGTLKDGRAAENIALLCHHLQPPGPEAYMCIPLAAQGEALGLLHIRNSPEIDLAGRSSARGQWFTESKQEFARSIAYRVALALANIKLRETLRQQSIRDPLTGLFNRRYMEESLEREIHRVTRNRRPLGVIMMDIDHFKNYNDSYGHEIGDVVLRELGLLLGSKIRKEDIACRFGGEEFVLILPDASLEVTSKRAQKLCEEVKRLDIKIKNQHLKPITMSLGVAAFPEEGPSGEAVLRAADAALYRAKQTGRARVVVADAMPAISLPADAADTPQAAKRRSRSKKSS